MKASERNLGGIVESATERRQSGWKSRKKAYARANSEHGRCRPCSGSSVLGGLDVRVAPSKTNKPPPRAISSRPVTRPVAVSHTGGTAAGRAASIRGSLRLGPKDWKPPQSFG
jgi:hypothetical protein